MAARRPRVVVVVVRSTGPSGARSIHGHRTAAVPLLTLTRQAQTFNPDRRSDEARRRESRAKQYNAAWRSTTTRKRETSTAQLPLIRANDLPMSSKRLCLQLSISPSGPKIKDHPLRHGESIVVRPLYPTISRCRQCSFSHLASRIKRAGPLIHKFTPSTRRRDASRLHKL